MKGWPDLFLLRGRALIPPTFFIAEPNFGPLNLYVRTAVIFLRHFSLGGKKISIETVNIMCSVSAGFGAGCSLSGLPIFFLGIGRSCGFLLKNHIISCQSCPQLAPNSRGHFFFQGRVSQCQPDMPFIIQPRK